MTTSKFDALTRSLATTTSRRKAMGLLFAGALGGVLGASGLGKALAAEEKCVPIGGVCSNVKLCCTGSCHYGKCCRSYKDKCNSNSDCCSGNCYQGMCRK